MSLHLGNVPASSTLYIPFASYGKTNGESITLTGLAVTDIEIYKNGSVTQRASDAGYALLDTDGIDFDGITGIHGFSIDLSDDTDAGFYAVGSFYWVVVSAVTIDGQTVNFIAATFRIVAAEAVAGKPKVDVDAWLGTAAATPTVAGVPEVDLTHVAGATTDVSALATNAAAILVDTAEIGVAGAGLTNINLPNQTMDITGNITGNLSGSVGSVTGAVGSVTAGVTLAASAVQAIWDALTSALTTVGSIGKLLVDNINATISSRLATSGYTAPPTVGQIADQVWDETMADHLTAGSTGASLNGAGSAGDPWTTALPGAYGAGTAGKIVGDNLNATVGSRSSHSAADVWAAATRTLTAFDSSFKTGYALSSAGVQAIWDALTSALTTVGSIGKLIVDNLNATISSRSSHSAADAASAVQSSATSNPLAANVKEINDVVVNGDGSTTPWGP